MLSDKSVKLLRNSCLKVSNRDRFSSLNGERRKFDEMLEFTINKEKSNIELSSEVGRLKLDFSVSIKKNRQCPLRFVCNSQLKTNYKFYPEALFFAQTMVI
ncbi:hypothetical protein J6590_009750 [Homalodisca vitripennis]|nr:hypothetical protein J6590_009750 [Homalodisca vitripennis]